MNKIKGKVFLEEQVLCKQISLTSQLIVVANIRNKKEKIGIFG